MHYLSSLKIYVEVLVSFHIALDPKTSAMRFPVFLYMFATMSPAISSSRSCYCFPNEACWPAQSAWDTLNTTVGGRLIATIPIGAPCHDPLYNATECALLRDLWGDVSLQ